MKKINLPEEKLLQHIIDTNGDCISTVWCLVCPFQKDCVGKAISKAKLLPKEERVIRAYNRLFDTLIEVELSDEYNP